VSPDEVSVPLGVASVDVALFQLLEAELARAEACRAALRCLADDPRSRRFGAPLEEAELHVAIVQSLLEAFGLDPEADVPARLPIRTMGRSLVDAMEQALALLDPPFVWLTAAECLASVGTQAERRWAHVARLAQLTQGAPGDALRAATREIATSGRSGPGRPRRGWLGRSRRVARVGSRRGERRGRAEGRLAPAIA
jgi:hypothetical protein